LGTRREIKNLNSFKFMQQAIDYEVRWQIEQIEDGHAIQQATVLFNPDTGETRAMRTKEDAADYRYFPDPDLPPLVIGRDWVERVRSEMAESPREMANRFVRNYGFLPEHAAAITTDRARAIDFDLFWSRLQIELGNEKDFSSAAVKGANWAMVEFSSLLNANKVNIEDAPVGPHQRAVLVARIIQGVINHNTAKEIFATMWREGGEVDAIIESKGLKQMNDSGELEEIIDEVLAANPKNVEEFKAGNTKALNGLVGPIMKASKGKANPAQVNELLLKKLG
jgi:aspartyl-tRNA(Asn)/glutamyl-tRNA(Gln) amidotransferase subunit B